MDLRLLRYFQAVAEEGHMTRAAARLGLQQPPLSQQIKALELQLGLQLFERHPKGVRLTEAGRLLQAEVAKILQDMADMQQRMARLAQGEQGRVALGFTSSAAAHRFTPAALRECRRRYPAISLELSEANAADITAAVLAHRLDCGLIRVPVSEPEELLFETLFREPVLLALPVDHPLLQGRPPQPRLSLTDLDGEALILARRPGAPGLYANLLEQCRALGVTPRIAAEVDRMMSNLNLVAAGAGISVVPASMQGTHPEAIVYCPLKEADLLDAPMTLVRRRTQPAGAVATFLALLAESVAG
ncbi:MULTISPECIES: LysR family transcriptional regulator [Roseateles]|uniref:LysR family transcriptional regulator n=1 Tax=Roseateles albus TaxID=2987525 RepID=A0ABT5KFV9_9BURK|nr:LysR family transcriptional regulator [Roseateles albus]MCV2358342.1 LysR family transcriptional regulator [Paucibacter sp. TC2R-5]MDC8772334.1 LysR family transcriptional regulator [Roseateles albus]